MKLGCVITDWRIKLEYGLEMPDTMANKFRSQPSASKIMLTLFWDMGMEAPAIQSRSCPQPIPYVWPNERSSIRGGRFSSSEEVIAVVQNWLKT
jgi:hypothetical protein